jgi:flagellar biosynthesis protein FliQ
LSAFDAKYKKTHGEVGAMTPDVSLHLFAQLLWQALVVSAPLLLTVLIVGLVVSIFQVVTQIQEMSLTFIPKLLASVAVLVLAGPWMLGQLVAYSSSLIRSIPRLV